MQNIKKWAIFGNIFFGALSVVSTICFMQLNANPYITKTLASTVFVITGLYNVILLLKFSKEKARFKSLMLLLGLVFACLGDILLIDHFIVGAALFAVGHVCFLIFFCLLYKPCWLDLIIALALIACAVLLVCFYPKFDFEGMRILIIAYAVVISLMLGKATGNFIRYKTKGNFVSFLGAFLFFFSDLMLLFFVFAGNILVFDYLCVYTYYPAEFILAISTLVLLSSKTDTKSSAIPEKNQINNN